MSSSSITYRTARKSDIDEFFPLFAKSIKELFPEYTQNSRTFLIEKDYNRVWMKSAIDQRDRILFLARSGERSVGYLMVNKVYGGVSCANWIAVIPAFQKQGIATNLLDMWTKYSVKNGAHSLQLWTADKNLTFYKRQGFVKVGKFKQAWFGNDINLLYKSIAKPIEENYLKKYLAGKS